MRPKKKKKGSQRYGMPLLATAEFFWIISYPTWHFGCLSMINSPSKDERVSYRNTSANYKGTGGSPQLGKHDWTLWFKVILMWAIHETTTGCCMVHKSQKQMENFHTKPWRPKKPYIQHRECEQLIRTWRQKEPTLNKGKNNTVI